MTTEQQALYDAALLAAVNLKGHATGTHAMWLRLLTDKAHAAATADSGKSLGQAADEAQARLGLTTGRY